MLFRKKKPAPTPDSDTIRKIVRALPPVRGEVELLNEKESLAVLANLKDLGSSIHDHLKAHYPFILASVSRELPRDPKRGNAFVLTERQLRGLIARAVIAGATQTAFDIGKNLQLAKELQGLFENSVDPSAQQAENGNGTRIPAEEPLDE